MYIKKYKQNKQIKKIKINYLNKITMYLIYNLKLYNQLIVIMRIKVIFKIMLIIN